MSFKSRNVILLLASLLCLYLMPHAIERVVLVGAGFAAVLIASSRPMLIRRSLLKYASYLAISVGTYYLLFQNQPWELLFGWLPDHAKQMIGVPVSACSIIMAFAGWLCALSEHTSAAVSARHTASADSVIDGVSV